MKKAVKWMLVFLIMVPTSAVAGYGDLKEEIDDYQPPALFHIKSSSVEAPALGVTEDQFRTEIEQLQKQQLKWEQSLTQRGAHPVFFEPGKALVESLRAAATDDTRASQLLAGHYTLPTIEILTLLRNASIRAAENRFRAASESFSQISSLDTILRQYSAFTEGIMTGVGPRKGKDPVAMKFPFPGVTALKGQMVNQEVTAAREAVEIARRDALTEARKIFWDLQYIGKSRIITRETLDLLDQLEEVATTRYEGGKTSFQDVIKIRIQRKTLNEELITLRETERNLHAALRKVLNLPPSSPVGSLRPLNPMKPIPSQKVLETMALENRQELRQMRARIGKMERMIELAETMIVPSYGLNLSLYDDEAVSTVGSSAMQESFPVTIAASRGAGLPRMPWYGTQDAFLRQARKNLVGLKAELTDSESVTISMVRNRWFDLDRARREIILYRDTVVDLSEAAMDVSTRGYESGAVSFADVISSYTMWLKAKLTLERKRSDFGIAWAELERVVGRSLNKR